MYHIPLKTRIRIRVRNFLAKWSSKLLLVWDVGMLVYIAYCMTDIIVGERPIILLPLYTALYAFMIWITYRQVKIVRR
jgi:hypothetical protein